MMKRIALIVGLLCGISAAQILNPPKASAGQGCITTATSAIANTDTIVVQTAALPANRLIAGTHIKATLSGNFTAAGAASPVWKMHIGTAGTTSDTSAYSLTGPTSATGGPIAFQVVLEKTIRTTGASATSYDTYHHLNSGTTGLAATVANTSNQAGSSFDTTGANFISVSFASGNASNNATFQDACIEVTNN